MLGLCSNKTCSAITKHDDGEVKKYNYGNKDGNYYNNASSALVSNGPIFDPIATPWSRLSLAEEDWATTKTDLWTRRRMYPRVGIYLPYKYPIDE